MQVARARCMCTKFFSLFMMDNNGEYFSNDLLEFDTNDPNNATNNITEEIDDNTMDIENYFGASNTPEPHQNDGIKLPPQRRCLPHLLNLLQKDFETKYLTGIAKKSLFSTLDKLRTLWLLTHRSSLAKTISKSVLGYVLITPNDTRWNSRYDAVKMCSRKDSQPKLNKLIQQLKSELTSVSAQNLQILTPSDFAIIQHYVNVLEPVAMALDTLQRKKKQQSRLRNVRSFFNETSYKNQRSRK